MRRLDCRLSVYFGAMQSLQGPDSEPNDRKCLSVGSLSMG
jgi:hypothetical protein